MGAVVDKFGALVAAQLPLHPERARFLLSNAYRLVGAQMRYLPPRRLGRAQSYIQSVVSPGMGRALTRADTCACVNVFLPCELLHAMDIPPMFPEGLSCYLTATAASAPFIQCAEEHGVPESYCSYHKLLLGLAESGVLPRPKVILNTSLACDANQLTFRRLAELYGVPRFTVDVPHWETEETVPYVADQLRAMGRFLSAHTGRPLSEARLRTAVSRSREAHQAYQRYLSLRADRSMPDEMTTEMFTVMALHVLLGSPEGARYAGLLAQQASTLPKAARSGIRLLWMHTLPYWQPSLKELLNFSSRYEIVACDMNYADLAEPDPDHPYESMARRLLSCSYNGGVERRVARTLEMAERLHADGVVYFCHWGCKQTSGGAGFAKSALERAGYPTLILDGDGCDTGNVNDGQMVTRMQAFLEQLGVQK